MNYYIFHLINGFAAKSDILDWIVVGITDSAPIVAILLMLYLWFYRGKENGTQKRRTAIYTVISVAMGLIMNFLIHKVYYHARPFAEHHVHQLVSHAADSSFVSDHALLAFTIAWMFNIRTEKFKGWVLAWALLVGISRIFVGVHYPADVIGSIVMSLLLCKIILIFKNRLEPIVQFVLRQYCNIALRIGFARKPEKFNE